MFQPNTMSNETWRVNPFLGFPLSSVYFPVDQTLLYQNYKKDNAGHYPPLQLISSFVGMAVIVLVAEEA